MEIIIVIKKYFTYQIFIKLIDQKLTLFSIKYIFIYLDKLELNILFTSI